MASLLAIKYIMLMIVAAWFFCLTFDGSLRSCFFKKDEFLVEMKKYMKEHGSDALEDLIASTKKSAKPDVSVKAIRADDAEDLFRTTSGSIPKDSNDVEITEKIEVASPKQTEIAFGSNREARSCIKPR
ncbi:hypothetical protein NC651_037794 [Populus alba x Populus x berolinensis]|nr:hypothetical protein NC651_037794 [Populus alba x Populus x berolinensis]